jgi:hypothetical protein
MVQLRSVARIRVPAQCNQQSPATKAVIGLSVRNTIARRSPENLGRAFLSLVLFLFPKGKVRLELESLFEIDGRAASPPGFLAPAKMCVTLLQAF